MIKLLAHSEEYNLDTKELRGVIDFTVNMSKAIETDYSRQRDQAEHVIVNKIVDIVVDKYLDNSVDELYKRIDIDTLVKRIQLKIVGKIGG